MAAYNENVPGTRESPVVVVGSFQMDHKLKDKTVCIAGLGYVCLPLALAFSCHLTTIGFDVDAGETAAQSVMGNGR